MVGIRGVPAIFLIFQVFSMQDDKNKKEGNQPKDDFSFELLDIPGTPPPKVTQPAANKSRPTITPPSSKATPPAKTGSAANPVPEKKVEDDDFEMSPEMMELDAGTDNPISPPASVANEPKPNPKAPVEERDSFDDALIQDEAVFEEDIRTGDGFDGAIAKVGSGIGEEEITKEVSFDEFLTESSRTGQFARIAEQGKGVTGRSAKSVPTQEMTAILSQEAEENGSDASSYITATPVRKGADQQQGLEIVKQGLQQAKTRIDLYLGRSLPKRELSLDFLFVAPKSKKEVGELVGKGEIRAIFNQKGTSLNQIFERAGKQLSILAKSKISTGARHAYLEVFSAAFVEKLKTVIVGYENKPTVPDDPFRQQMAEFCLDGLHNLIYGYKQVYSEIYGLPNIGYGPQRATANSMAFHVFELVCLEQQLMGCVYKRLPAGSIATINKLFVVLSLYEPELVDEVRESEALGRPVSIRQMFLHIELASSFDLMYFSAQEHGMVNHYLDHHFAQLRFLTGTEAVADTTTLKLVMSHESRDPALVTRKVDSAAMPATVVVLDELFSTIKAHFAECLTLLEHRKPVHSSPVLAPRKISECLSMLGILNTFVEQMEKNTRVQTYNTYKAMEDLSVFAGFQECFMYFRDKNAGREDHRTMKDSLAKRSSFMSDDKDSQEATMWFCAMETDRLMCLQTLETRFTVKMDVGWLMLILRKKDKEEHTTLTRILRMERLQGGKVNLIVEKIGIKAVNVAFEPWLSTEATKGQLLPALITTMADGKYFVAPNNDRFWKGRQFKVILPNKKQVPLMLDTLHAATSRFQVFRLQ